MTETNRTTISLSTETRDWLFDRKQPAESYDETVTRLLEQTEPAN
ncbi:hypothetical protein ACFR97_17665 [Haloplanus litoreus]|uniref:CopG family transcriptional regulator n=1 Tax=Haloplanus litoreus TaxID=767515 RepID=A0ABD6A4V5_9EURY